MEQKVASLYARFFMTPVSIGIGGPLASLVIALTGYSRVMPWWVLCPVWGMMAVLLVFLCPVLLPLYVLWALQRSCRQRYALQLLAEETELLYATADALEEKARTAPQEEQEQDSTAATTVTTSDSITAAATTTTSTSTDTNAKAESTDHSDISNDVDDKGFGDGKQHLISSKVVFNETEEKIKLERNYERMGLHLARLHLWSEIKSHLGTILLSLCGYYAVAVAVFYGVTSASVVALNEYMAKAKENPVLQIATPEQIAYANNMTAIFTIGILVLMVAMLLCFTITTVSVLRLPAMGLRVLMVIIKNLPGFAMILALFYGVVMIMERYYAHFRVVAVEAMIRGTSYFDPSLTFIVLRLYVAQALVLTLVLMVLMSLNLLPQRFSAKRSAFAPQ